MVLGWLTLSVACLFASGVPGEQWAATVFCRHCRSPEPLVCHWVALGECLIEGNADPAAFTRTDRIYSARERATAGVLIQRLATPSGDYCARSSGATEFQVGPTSFLALWRSRSNEMF